jgi:hypothetical protein
VSDINIYYYNKNKKYKNLFIVIKRFCTYSLESIMRISIIMGDVATQKADAKKYVL